MFRPIRILLALGVVLTLGCASQPEPAPPPAAASEAVKASEIVGDEEKVVVVGAAPKSNVVCRDEPRTGSRLRKRRCYTRQEIDQMSAQARKWLLTGGDRGAVQRIPQSTVSTPE